MKRSYQIKLLTYFSKYLKLRKLLAGDFMSSSTYYSTVFRKHKIFPTHVCTAYSQDFSHTEGVLVTYTTAECNRSYIIPSTSVVIAHHFWGLGQRVPYNSTKYLELSSRDYEIKTSTRTSVFLKQAPT